MLDSRQRPLKTVRRISLVLGSGLVLAASPDLQFNRDVRLLLSENCLACHGPDPGSRKAGLRLDTRESLFGQTKGEGPVVVPGKPEQSALWKRLVHTDPDELMPPPESHKELKAEQKELIRRWILEGAAWQPHWSFLKPERPAAPQGSGRTPIDAFVSAKLAAKGLTMNPEADRRTLARRVALDLTGLPPLPGEVEAFVKDTSPDAYERWVDRLLDSPRWGEHRGRYWLDAARYADTHGLHFDNYREMWPYRDWVIAAFNRNQPFDRFVVEQIAGDLLPDPTQDQLVATGFHRCNMTTNEGGTIEEENLVGYANDRVSTTGWVFLGLTTNCSACHDHKFDPFTQRDFYSMAAFFRNTQQSGFDGNVKDGANASMVVVTDPVDADRWAALLGQIDAAKKAVDQARSEAGPAMERWIGGLRKPALESGLELPGQTFRAALASGQTNPIPVTVAGKGIEVPTAGPITLRTNGLFGPAPVFGKDATARVEDVGAFETNQSFSFGGWIRVPADSNATAAVLARMDPPSESYRGWDLWVQGGQFATHIIHKWPDSAIKVATKDSVVRKGQWQHVWMGYDGSGKPSGVSIHVDGVPVPVSIETDKPLTGTIRARAPLTFAQRSGGDHFDGVALQDVRVFSRVLSSTEITALARNPLLLQVVGKPVPDWNAEVRGVLLETFIQTQSRPVLEAREALARLEAERDGIRRRHPVTHIQREKADSKPMAALLARGQYDKPGERVEANVPAALNPLPEGAPRNRMGLALWLVSPENPLLARVTVNRFWQELFGTGLVKTTEDFGIMGETPVNPELLDWLAVDFRESGWDVKRFFKQVVMSQAYRQDARVTPEKLEKDPQNRLVSRGPRFRMDAEMVRDYALAASGLLVPKVGGASVKPYQPEGVWEAVAMPESNTKRYERDSGDALYRRSLYTFWKRAAPPASMEIFNAPSREVSCTRRERTNTPLQALATLNDPQFIEAARRLAERAWTEASGNPHRAVERVSERLLMRPLTPEEQGMVRRSFDEFSTFYRGHPEAADQLMGIGELRPSGGVPTPDLAALTLVANQLFNLDEVLNK
ncbi:MAG: DUF1553 domain-containing protein [Verrucomicrobia bacterium]|nr:DUF1553 domain-containing protein [Verrucomicrobiota bacterium]